LSQKQIAEKQTICFREWICWWGNTLLAVCRSDGNKVGVLCEHFHESDVVFLDEPTGGVDPATRKQFWTYIRGCGPRHYVFVKRTSWTRMNIAIRISIRVDGKIMALGSPAEMTTICRHRYGRDVFRLLARGAKRGD
jgi:ABC-2 type transport system ATP-binding protein